jgi:hypothetical protein
MGKPSPRNPDRVIALLLFCTLCGVLLGLGARALRLRGQRTVPLPAPVVTPLSCPPPPDLGGLERAPRPRLDGAGAAADGGAAVTGRALLVVVLDPRGQPVKGATVFARVDPAPSELASPAALGAHPPTKAAPTPIGELGVLAGPLPFPEDVIGGSFLPPGAVQHGSGSGGAELSAASDEKGLARLAPLPVGRLQVQVSYDGKSAAAEVWVPAAPPGAVHDSDATALRLVLRLGAPPDTLCSLPGETEAPGEAAAAPGAADGPEVAGRVEDPRGFPVSGARIELTVGRNRTQTLSDPRGGFSARGLPVGALMVQVQRAGYAPLTISLAADKPRGELRLKLQPGGGIAGTLRDGRAGGVPPGTQLYAESEGGLRQAIVVGSDGRFSAIGLVPGDLTLHARAPGYAPLVQTVKVPGADSQGEITVRDLRLELWHGATLRGRVYGESGDVAGATVTITLLPPGGGERQLARVVTDPRGEFVASDLPPGRVRVSAVAGGGSKARGELELQAGDNAHTELELR